MINYIEKGHWLHDYIAEQGYTLTERDGVWESSDDEAVQVIINGFNSLPYALEEAKTRLVKEASRRSAFIYPFIDSDSEQAIGLYNFATDLYLSTVISSREPLSGRLLDFKNIYDIVIATIAIAETITDWRVLESYDSVNTPNWP